MTPAGPIAPWGDPDARGIRARFDKHRTKRFRYSEKRDSISLTKWPTEWRGLVAAWLRLAASSVTQQSLFRAAGNARHLAYDVLEGLLENGWIELEERFARGMWTPYRVVWISADDLREVLGIPRRDTVAKARLEALSAGPGDSRLTGLHASLEGRPSKVVLARTALLASLGEWWDSERTGTRQQFSHFARGDTKLISQSEWDWLSAHISLDEAGISRHTPVIYLRAPFGLITESGRIDLTAVPDLVGLSPATVRAVKAIDGLACRWLLVENRTSFEDIARRAGDGDAVVWLPGFAPDWWLEAMAHLLSLFPREALIAADPDPAGIDIALRAGALWRGNWRPWGMSPETLRSIGKTKELNDYDRQRLAIQLASSELPAPLRALANCLLDSNRKGEQEALDLMSWL